MLSYQISAYRKFPRCTTSFTENIQYTAPVSLIFSKTRCSRVFFERVPHAPSRWDAASRIGCGHRHGAGRRAGLGTTTGDPASALGGRSLGERGLASAALKRYRRWAAVVGDAEGTRMPKQVPKRRNPRKFQWPRHLLKLLGKVSDAEVARRAGVVVSTVIHERWRRGIPPAFPQRPPVEWTDEMTSLLGTAIDREVAVELGIPMWSVAYRRKKLGIPPYCEQPPKPPTFWTPQRDALLGTASDAAIAKKLRIKRGRVWFRRRALGIPPFSPAPARAGDREAGLLRKMRWSGRSPTSKSPKRSDVRGRPDHRSSGAWRLGDRAGREMPYEIPGRRNPRLGASVPFRGLPLSRYTRTS